MSFKTDPTCTDEQAAAVHSLSVSAFRKRIARGALPGPVTRGRWDRSRVWSSAVKDGVRTVREAPLDALSAILDGHPGGFYLRSSRTTSNATEVEWTHSATSLSIVLLYFDGGTHWEHRELDTLLASSQYGARPGDLTLAATADFVVIVGSEADVYAHRTMTRALNVRTGEWWHMALADVAATLRCPIPYWPFGLRHVPVPDVTQRGPADLPPTAPVSGLYSDALHLAASAIAATGTGEAGEAASALRDYANAVRWRYHDDCLEDIARVGPVLITEGSDTSMERYLYLAVAPQSPPAAPGDASERLITAAWSVPVGRSEALLKAARLIEEDAIHDPAHRGFNSTPQASGVFAAPTSPVSPAQENLRGRLLHINDDAATIAHLALRHPRSLPADEEHHVEYLTDPLTGTVAELFTDGWISYSVPRGDNVVREQPALFDFTVAEQPFAWTAAGAAVPLPPVAGSGFNLGYSGSGPRAVTESVFAFLGQPDPPSEIDFPWYTGAYRHTYTPDEILSIRDRQL